MLTKDDVQEIKTVVSEIVSAEGAKIRKELSKEIRDVRDRVDLIAHRLDADITHLANRTDTLETRMDRVEQHVDLPQ